MSRHILVVFSHCYFSTSDFHCNLYSRIFWWWRDLI